MTFFKNLVYDVTCDEHAWEYGYVRGRDDKFSYPFPVWVATRKCSTCGRREVLVPFMMNFNSGVAEWTEESLTEPFSPRRVEDDKKEKGEHSK